MGARRSEALFQFGFQVVDRQSRDDLRTGIIPDKRKSRATVSRLAEFQHGIGGLDRRRLQVISDQIAANIERIVSRAVCTHQQVVLGVDRSRYRRERRAIVKVGKMSRRESTVRYEVGDIVPADVRTQQTDVVLPIEIRLPEIYHLIFRIDDDEAAPVVLNQQTRQFAS